MILQRIKKGFREGRTAQGPGPLIASLPLTLVFGTCWLVILMLITPLVLAWLLIVGPLRAALRGLWRGGFHEGNPDERTWPAWEIAVGKSITPFGMGPDTVAMLITLLRGYFRTMKLASTPENRAVLAEEPGLRTAMMSTSFMQSMGELRESGWIGDDDDDAPDIDLGPLPPTRGNHP